MRRSSRIALQSASAAQNGVCRVEPSSVSEDEDIRPTNPQRTRSKKTARPQGDASNTDDADEYVGSNTVAEPPIKRRKVVARSSHKNKYASAQLHERLFGKLNDAVTVGTSGTSTAQISLPIRVHNLDYHRPLMLDSRKDRESLLKWFGGVSATRKMPWRKPWIDPTTTSQEGLRQQLERRAYEVWISEIMLQQTRVAVVIDYWNRWMARWPTIHDLAAAQPDEVLAAWRGLGYYSRATRIHDAAKMACADPDLRGLLPCDVDELVARVPGVGRYTAGAISAIVFGIAAPMVDGNVLRVLSRQIGLFGDVKSDKTVIDLLWAVADRLVKAVARDDPSMDDILCGSSKEEEGRLSDRPGRWGQALMELGSTVCTPKPNCALCPISASCRVYGEGLQSAVKRSLATGPAVTNGGITDIEDACTLCKPFLEYAEEMSFEMDDQIKVDNASEKKPRSRVRATLQSFAFTQQSTSKSRRTPDPQPPESSSTPLGSTAIEVIANHAKKFPVKRAKKAVREEETVVCAIRRSDGRYLIHRRPEKGLLAGLWEMPSYVLRDAPGSTAKTRRMDAEQYVAGLVNDVLQPKKLKYVGDLGSVPWLFSHLKLTMHVHLFELEGSMAGKDESEGAGVGDVRTWQSRWSGAVAIDDESMGTGMRKCWALVREASK
ncbi:DNA glycosylase [Hypoxylon sp. NC1633]|nr:DNA glycosylase [Hypoxylon sp. NC1633]